MIYALLGLCIALLGVLAVAMPRTARPAGWLVAVALAALAALRATSVDYDEYAFLMELMGGSEDLDLLVRLFLGKDPLFGLLMVTVSDNGWDLQWLFILSALLSVGLKWWAFERAFGEALFGLAACFCVYFFLHDFTQVRVAIALAWCYLGYVALHQGRPGWALTAVLVGAGFHASVGILLFYGPLLRLGPRWRWPLTAGLTVLLLLGLPLVLGVLGGADGRGESNTVQASVTAVPLVIASCKLAVLAWITPQLLRRCPPEVASLLPGCLLLCAVGCAFLFFFRGASAALAFRTYELFDAFSVFTLAMAWRHGGATVRLAAGGVCAVALAVYASAGLLVPYAVARF